MILEVYAVWINSNNDFGIFLRPVLISFSAREELYNYRFVESDEEQESIIPPPSSPSVGDKMNGLVTKLEHLAELVEQKKKQQTLVDELHGQHDEINALISEIQVMIDQLRKENDQTGSTIQTLRDNFIDRIGSNVSKNLGSLGQRLSGIFGSNIFGSKPKEEEPKVETETSPSKDGTKGGSRRRKPALGKRRSTIKKRRLRLKKTGKKGSRRTKRGGWTYKRTLANTLIL